jgi:DNA repair protein RadC
MEIKVLDHIIIGNNCYFSFADQGLLESYQLRLRDTFR